MARAARTSTLIVQDYRAMLAQQLVARRRGRRVPLKTAIVQGQIVFNSTRRAPL